jgi:hypothetical protein
MRHMDVSGAVRHIYVIRRLKVNEDARSNSHQVYNETRLYIKKMPCEQLLVDLKNLLIMQKTSLLQNYFINQL